MKRVLSSKAMALAALACVSAGVGALVACSSSSSSGTPAGADGGGGGGEGGTTMALSCANSTIPILFSPMYSAYVTDSTQQSFQIPAVINDSAIDPTTVTWGASDPSMVSFVADPVTGGTMITVQKAGKVQIIAKLADGTCGASELDVTPATEAQWQAGNARYNSTVPVDFSCIRRGVAADGGVCADAGPGCISCHGPTANGEAGVGFIDIAHTPEQTGGFSDQDLIDIVVNGIVPGCGDAGGTCPTADSGYFDNNIISYRFWQRFHHWDDIQGSEQQAMVVYLRSLTPTPQNGTSNFGGHFDGGHHHHDGGPDGSTQPEAGPTEAAAGDATSD